MKTINAPNASGYAPLEGIDLYYEVHGSGLPLIMLHGGFGSTETLGEPLSALSQSRQVIAVDLQAHGRTADVGRPMTTQAMADDIAGLIAYLELGKSDLIGYSLGGAVSLQTTIRHPELVRKQVLVSIPCKRTAWFPESRAAMDQMGEDSIEQLKHAPFYEVYARTAPRPEDWPRLVMKLANLIQQDYDLSEEVTKIEAPTMLFYGDADDIQLEHALEFFNLLGGGFRGAGWDGSGFTRHQLAILPRSSHYNIFASPDLIPAAERFLDRD